MTQKMLLLLYTSTLWFHRHHCEELIFLHAPWIIFFLMSLLLILPSWLRLIKPYQNQKILEFKLPKYFGILLLLSPEGMQELEWSGNTASQKQLCCCLHLIFCLAAHASLMSLITVLHSLHGHWSPFRSGFRAAVINQMLTRGDKAGFWVLTSL